MTLAAGVTLGLLVVAAPAAGKGSEIDGYGIYLTNAWDGAVDRAFTYGRDEDRLSVGNWDGRGGDTLAVREERTSRGIPPVTAVPALRPAALRHSQWMAEEGIIEHRKELCSRRGAPELQMSTDGAYRCRPIRDLGEEQ